MKKIVGIIHPFDIYQTFYVYDEGTEVETVQTKIRDIPNTVFELSRVYNIDSVDLSGAKEFSVGIVKQIREKEISKYNTNKLIINCV